MRRFTLLATAAVLTLSACGSGGSTTNPGSAPEVTATGTQPASGGLDSCPAAGSPTDRTTSFDAAPQLCIDPERTYTADVKTDAGDVRIELLADKAPNTVNNFVVLSRMNYYNGVTFHRVIPGFMIQGGDPEGTGMGGPGYTFEDELPQAGEYQVGSLAMANAGPNTNGSQFFIVTGDAGVGLPPQYSLFGKVTSGMDVVQKIEADGSDSGQPTKVHTIESVTITED